MLNPFKIPPSKTISFWACRAQVKAPTTLRVSSFNGRVAPSILSATCSTGICWPLRMRSCKFRGTGSKNWKEKGGRVGRLLIKDQLSLLNNVVESWPGREGLLLVLISKARSAWRKLLLLLLQRGTEQAVHRATKLSYEHSQPPKSTGRTKPTGVPSPGWRTCLTSDLNLRARHINTQIESHFWALFCSTWYDWLACVLWTFTSPAPFQPCSTGNSEGPSALRSSFFNVEEKNLYINIIYEYK